jgi:UDP-3-O-[3-hydroxymyristoyl] N-acetylglucosamine deacetylase
MAEASGATVVAMPTVAMGDWNAVLSSSVQHTLADVCTLSGVGLHSGLPAQVWLKPAQPGEGRYFIRVDHPDCPKIPAHISALCSTQLSTELALHGVSIRTIEHLLAALVGMGVDNVRIEIDGSEVPLLDGSAYPWVKAIASVGLTPQPSAPRSTLSLSEPVWVHQNDAFVAAIPAPELRFSYGIDFSLSAIGHQWHSWLPFCEPFADTLAPARTFGLAHQINTLRDQGLIRGGSLENALVCDQKGWLNPPLRFSNEPVRHKLLDLVGDISLLGILPNAHILAYKASHFLHTQLVLRLAQEYSYDSERIAH